MPSDRTLEIIVNRKHELVKLSEILYAEAQGRKVVLCLADREVEYYERFGVLAGKLGTPFFRCHRSYLVNLDYAVCVENGELLLSVKNLRIPVARPLRRFLKEKIQKN